MSRLASWLFSSRGAREDVTKSKGDNRPVACRSAPATAAQRRTSVPLDRNTPGEEGLTFVGVDRDCDATVQRRRSLPVETRLCGERVDITIGTQRGASAFSSSMAAQGVEEDSFRNRSCIVQRKNSII